MLASGFLTTHHLNKTDDPKTWKVEASGIALFQFQRFLFKLYYTIRMFTKQSKLHNVLNREYLI